MGPSIVENDVVNKERASPYRLALSI